MKRSTASILPLLAFCLAANAFAGLMLIPIVDIVLTSPGETRTFPLFSNRLLVSTRGLSTAAVVDCGGDRHCLDSGLEGAAVDIVQDLRIAIDFTGAGVAGRSRGELVISNPSITLPDSVKFVGDVRGTAACVETPPSPCATVRVSMRLRAPLTGLESDALQGIMEIRIAGELAREGRGTRGWSWTSIAGAGSLALLTDD